ncbi:MAG: nuclease [Microbacterium sp.]
MSARTTSTILPIQRVMAAATPSSWRDGVVIETNDELLVVAWLDGATTTIRVVGPAVELVAGEPVAYHPVAEVLYAGRSEVTARPSA